MGSSLQLDIGCCWKKLTNSFVGSGLNILEKILGARFPFDLVGIFKSTGIYNFNDYLNGNYYSKNSQRSKNKKEFEFIKK